MTKLPPIQPLTFTMQKVALDAISANPANPRKHFDEAKLQELAASITAAGGILQAPGVRPLKVAGQTAPGKFVFIYGERRGRAAGLLKWKEIDVKVYDVDDVKAAELALIENLQREDLTPLERAAGYEDLHKKHGLSYDDIAAHDGVSRSAVYQTVALLSLSADAKKELADEDSPFTASHAAELAALPKEFHEQALDTALGGPFGDGPLSLRDFKQWISEEFMLDLAKAPFDTKDATLVPKAGACTTCPKRTGYGQMDLLAGKKAVDLCKDKPCFGSKSDAHLTRQAKAGKKVLSAEQAEEVFPQENGDFIAHRAGYVRADAKEAGAKKTFGEQVAPEQRVLAKVPGSGEIVELVPTSALPKPAKSESAVKREKDPEEARREREHKARGAIQVELINAMSKSKDVEIGTDLFLRAVGRGLSRSVQSEPTKQLCKRFGLEPEPGDDFREMFFDKIIDTLGGAPLRRAVLQLAYADSVPDFMYGGGLDDTLLAGAKMLRIDADKVEAAVRKELKEQGSAKTASKKAGEELAVKIAKVEAGTKLTPHQKAALISGLKSSAASKAKPVVEKVPTKALAAEAKRKTAKKKPAKKAKAKKGAKR